MHNKRNDRLAEGHGSVAEAAMVLRTLSDRAPLQPVCHGLSSTSDVGTFRVWLEFSACASLRRTFRFFPPGRFFWEVLALLPRSAASAPFFKAAQP